MTFEELHSLVNRSALFESGDSRIAIGEIKFLLLLGRGGGASGALSIGFLSSTIKSFY